MHYATIRKLKANAVLHHSKHIMPTPSSITNKGVYNITNLASDVPARVLTKQEIKVLALGLKHIYYFFTTPFKFCYTERLQYFQSFYTP
jgi:hypothetical protein